MSLWIEIAIEYGDRCRISTVRDQKTVSDRVRHEGLSFLTITLPQYCQDFQKSLDSGFVDSTAFKSFKRRRGLPAFLSGFLSRVFSNAGVLLDNPCIESISAIRQLTLVFSKIELDCSPERINQAFDKYIKCEQDVRESDRIRDESIRREFNRISSLLYSDLFTKVDAVVYNGNLVPRHGPGATADHLIGNQKFRQREWTARLVDLFPAHDYLFPSPSYWREAQSIDILEPGQERPVRVITVPKTLKTPRIIAIEPTCMQYMQQALWCEISERVEESYLLRSFVGFNDQVPNQIMARDGSQNGNLATLDLSEASDRVSNQHVRDLLRNHPWLFRAVDATRSRKADVRGKIIRLAKFASMGSALCFPMEAFVFLTLCFVGIQKSLGRQLSLKDIKSFIGKVRVFGDDIIIPTDTVPSVVSVLEANGFKVNGHKSFWNGKFRESCGKEYFDGHDVSTVKVRRVFPRRRTDVEEIVSLVALRNNMYQHGLWRVTRMLDERIKRFLDLPTVHPSSPSLGRHTVLPYQVDRICRSKHSPLVRGYALRPIYRKNSLDGTGALLKFFLRRGTVPLEKGHLIRSGRPTSVSIKRRWMQPF